MSNALTISQLPQHLQALMGNSSLSNLNQAAAGGISSGSWPRISIKGNRFRLQDPQGQEVIVSQHYLDVVIIDANPYMSKIFYKSNYDPNAEGSAPDCYSDNGVGPSARSTSPQCGTCAQCPNNVWGSKITPTGSQVKACADVKKVAVLLADNTGGPVFELRIPGASLGNFGAYVRALDAAQIPAWGIVTRLQFDTSADYPKLLFNAPEINQMQPLPWANYPYITQEMAQDVMEVAGSDEVSQCTGKKDTPIDPLKVGAAATSVIAVQPNIPTGGTPQHSLPMPRAPHVSGPPLHPSQVGQTPPPNPAFPHAGQPAQEQSAVSAKRARVRKSAEQSPAVIPPGVYQGAPQSVDLHPVNPPTFLKTGQNAANATVPLNPPVTNAALDETIRNVMNI